MARGGFLGRIGRAIRNVVTPAARRPTPPPAPPPPEPPRRRHDPYRQIWRDTKEGRRGDFRRHKALFDRMMRDVREDDPAELERLWESYIENLVNKGTRRNSTNNMFWRDSGIDPSDFDWAVWRAAMNYKRGK